MSAISRSIDPVVVGEDLRGIAAQYRKPPEVFGQRHGMIERRAELRMEDVRVAAEPLVQPAWQAP